MRPTSLSAQGRFVDRRGDLRVLAGRTQVHRSAARRLGEQRPAQCQPLSQTPRSPSMVLLSTQSTRWEISSSVHLRNCDCLETLLTGVRARPLATFLDGNKPFDVQDNANALSVNNA